MKRGGGKVYSRVWDSSQPLSSYDPFVRKAFSYEAKRMIADLKNQTTSIVYERVQKEDENHECTTMRRHVEGQSPDWWLEIFHANAYSHTRKKGDGKPFVRARGPKHSKVPRAAMIDALEAIVEGEDHEVGEPVEFSRTHGYGKMRYPHRRSERQIKGRHSSIDGYDSLVKYFGRNPGASLSDLPRSILRVIERVYGNGRINDAKRAVGVDDRFIRESYNGKKVNGADKRVSAKLLFRHTSDMNVTSTPYINHARAREAVFRMIASGNSAITPGLYEKVRDYFSLRNPSRVAALSKPDGSSRIYADPEDDGDTSFDPLELERSSA
jgi:hypothetical protein